MGRKVDVGDLVGFKEIADRLNLGNANTVRSWQRRHPDFPAPVAKLGIGHVFAWSEVEGVGQPQGPPHGGTRSVSAPGGSAAPCRHRYRGVDRAYGAA